MDSSSQWDTGDPYHEYNFLGLAEFEMRKESSRKAQDMILLCGMFQVRMTDS